MIVGSGMLANAFHPFQDDLHGYLIFASGVSNSGETRNTEFEREHELLKSHVSSNIPIIYFSTCSIYDSNSMNSDYVQHKLRMENLVKSSSGFYIFRLPQVVGKTINPYTLVNYLYNKIINDDVFELWDESTRNLIDVDDVAIFVNYFIHHEIGLNTITNIACPFSVSVKYIVNCLEKTLGHQARYNIVESKSDYKINTELVSSYSERVGAIFDDTYIDKIMSKYYL